MSVRCTISALPWNSFVPLFVTALIDNPAEGLQLIARDTDGTPLGFACEVVDELSPDPQTWCW